MRSDFCFRGSLGGCVGEGLKGQDQQPGAQVGGHVEVQIFPERSGECRGKAWALEFKQPTGRLPSLGAVETSINLSLSSPVCESKNR